MATTDQHERRRHGISRGLPATLQFLRNLQHNPNRLAKSALYAVGIVATLAFGLTKSEPALRWATRGSTAYGDLYHFAKVKCFRPAQPLGFSPPRVTAEFIAATTAPSSASPVFVFGDSFGFAAPVRRQFYQRLQSELGQPLNLAHYGSAGDPRLANPLAAFQRFQVPPMTNGVVVFEIVERLIEPAFSHPVPVQPAPSRARQSHWAFLENTETHHEMLLRYSFLTFPGLECWNSMLFRFCGRLPLETPWYSLNPPCLYYVDEVSCFRKPHSDQLIDGLAANISGLDTELRTRYGASLLLVPAPNKVTVYSRLVTSHKYDDFLPRLCQALAQRHVATVDLTGLFQGQPGLLYHPTDTHWNDEGARLAVQQTLKCWPRMSNAGRGSRWSAATPRADRSSATAATLRLATERYSTPAGSLTAANAPGRGERELQ